MFVSKPDSSLIVAIQLHVGVNVSKYYFAGLIHRATHSKYKQDRFIYNNRKHINKYFWI